LESGSGSRNAKRANKKRKKREEISCFEMLDVLFGGADCMLLLQLESPSLRSKNKNII
jgi:hypothetical protein